jgi:hypothetical protein
MQRERERERERKFLKKEDAQQQGRRIAHVEGRHRLELRRRHSQLRQSAETANDTREKCEQRERKVQHLDSRMRICNDANENEQRKRRELDRKVAERTGKEGRDVSSWNFCNFSGRLFLVHPSCRMNHVNQPV